MPDNHELLIEIRLVVGVGVVVSWHPELVNRTRKILNAPTATATKAKRSTRSAHKFFALAAFAELAHLPEILISISSYNSNYKSTSDKCFACQTLNIEFEQWLEKS